MAGQWIDKKTWAKFDVLVGERGWSVSRAAKEVNIGRTSAHAHIKQQGLGNGEAFAKRRKERHEAMHEVPPPLTRDQLGPEALRALDDFAYFRLRYMGHKSTPWQVMAAETTVELLASPDDEYVVTNMPPGSGKSTLFTHDLIAWMIVRNREIRILLGSRTKPQAQRFVARLKTTFERTSALRGAEQCLAEDYGRLKPSEPDLWRADQFVVDMVGGVKSGEKEATVMAAAQETGFLGGRFEVCVWDDLVDGRNYKTQNAREELQDWYEREAETRLEPGGCFLLVGQRIGPDDLYRFALNIKMGVGEDGEELEELSDAPPKYRHIVYQAHHEEMCELDHGKDAKAWPEGCLLDPWRLSWRKLATLKAQNPKRFDTSYQQADVDREASLVKQEWLTGGVGPGGEMFVGCYDHYRGPGQMPEGLDGPFLSVITVDPSPTKWWSIQWWLYHEASEQRILMDHLRAQMSADMFLDSVRGTTIGVAEDWAQRAHEMGVPLDYVVMERNAAQRFMLQYNFVQEWSVKHGLQMIAHDTHSNKADAEFGVQMIASPFRLGQMRLPYSHPYGKQVTTTLTSELLKWPEGRTEDCVMACWFMEYNLPNLKSKLGNRPTMSRPSWISKTKWARPRQRVPTLI